MVIYVLLTKTTHQYGNEARLGYYDNDHTFGSLLVSKVLTHFIFTKDCLHRLDAIPGLNAKFKSHLIRCLNPDREERDYAHNMTK
jgi:hypothetical protein